MINKLAITGVFTLAAYALSACSQTAANPTDTNIQTSNSEDARIIAFETSIRKWDERGKTDADRWSISQRMATYGVPGASVAIIHKGELVWLQGYGVQSANSSEQVDPQTVFSAGSVSKIINAALILRLVQDGTLDLDEDVNSYLSSWKVPTNKYTAQTKVTLRAILSHTSGLSQHGFRDFQPGEKLPTAIQTLNGEPPATHKPVSLIFEPGEKMKYSGGGVTVSQVLVEDVTGLSYLDAAQKYVFSPLGMKRSTFSNPLPETHGNIARAHDENGKARALPRGYEAMPEMAASGLWTSAEDLAIFIQALLMDDSAFLTPSLREDMLTRVPQSWHGLGPRLNGTEEKSVFHHGGANNSYQTWIEGHPAQGNGFVVLTNGEDGRRLAYELRVAAEESLGWPINFPDDYDEPSFE